MRRTLAALAIALLSQPCLAQSLARIEVRAVESVHLSSPQFLNGERGGKPVILAGELRIPRPAPERVPAVILIHGSGGIGPATDRWAQELNGIGVAAFILDTFSGRGIVSTVADQSQLDSIAMMTDAFRALAVLAAHPRIDPQRIGVMGFSKGAVAAVYSSNQRFVGLHSPQNLQFAAHIGLYTPCNVRYQQDERTTGKPIRMFHGIADDYVSIEPCRGYVTRLKSAGADVALTEYPGAHHAYDAFNLKEVVQAPQSQTTRNCWLQEGAAGGILNAKTGQPYDISKDPCVEKGPHVGYNAAAAEATTRAVKEFLVSTFRLPAP